MDSLFKGHLVKGQFVKGHFVKGQFVKKILLKGHFVKRTSGTKTFSERSFWLSIFLYDCILFNI